LSGVTSRMRLFEASAMRTSDDRYLWGARLPHGRAAAGDGVVGVTPAGPGRAAGPGEGTGRVVVGRPQAANRAAAARAASRA